MSDRDRMRAALVGKVRAPYFNEWVPCPHSGYEAELTTDLLKIHCSACGASWTGRPADLPTVIHWRPDVFDKEPT